MKLMRDIPMSVPARMSDSPRDVAEFAAQSRITIVYETSSARRVVNAKGHFPAEQAAPKIPYLVTGSLDPKGTGQAR